MRIRVGQNGQKRRYDTKVRPWVLPPGQCIHLLLPSSANKLLVKWQGPYEVISRKGEVEHEVQIPRQGIKLFHFNLLKEWHDSETAAMYGAEPDWDEEGHIKTKELRKQMI